VRAALRQPRRQTREPRMSSVVCYDAHGISSDAHLSCGEYRCGCRDPRRRRFESTVSSNGVVQERKTRGAVTQNTNGTHGTHPLLYRGNVFLTFEPSVSSIGWKLRIRQHNAEPQSLARSPSRDSGCCGGTSCSSFCRHAAPSCLCRLRVLGMQSPRCNGGRLVPPKWLHFSFQGRLRLPNLPTTKCLKTTRPAWLCGIGASQSSGES
jgi:hypothetical protein